MITIRHRQVHIHGYRLHHGFAGCVLILTGLALAWDDRKDRSVWWPSRP